MLSVSYGTVAEAQQGSLANANAAHDSIVCMKAPANKSTANQRKEHNVNKKA